MSIFFPMNTSFGKGMLDDPDDANLVDRALRRLGVMRKPLFGSTNPMRDIYAGLERFQRDNDLAIDGFMRTRGPTAAKLAERLNTSLAGPTPPSAGNPWPWGAIAQATARTKPAASTRPPSRQRPVLLGTLDHAGNVLPRASRRAGERSRSVAPVTPLATPTTNPALLGQNKTSEVANSKSEEVPCRDHWLDMRQAQKILDAARFELHNIEGRIIKLPIQLEYHKRQEPPKVFIPHGPFALPAPPAPGQKPSIFDLPFLDFGKTAERNRKRRQIWLQQREIWLAKLKALENSLAEAEEELPAAQEAVDVALTAFEAAKARHDACVAASKK